MDLVHRTTTRYAFEAPHLITGLGVLFSQTMTWIWYTIRYSTLFEGPYHLKSFVRRVCLSACPVHRGACKSCQHVLNSDIVIISTRHVSNEPKNQEIQGKIPENQ